MDATDVLSADAPSGKVERIVNSGGNEDDEAPTVEEAYEEVTTTKRKTIRTSIKIQELFAKRVTGWRAEFGRILGKGQPSHWTGFGAKFARLETLILESWSLESTRNEITVVLHLLRCKLGIVI